MGCTSVQVIIIDLNAGTARRLPATDRGQYTRPPHST
jgi:hypothetical protein